MVLLVQLAQLCYYQHNKYDQNNKGDVNFFVCTHGCLYLTDPAKMAGCSMTGLEASATQLTSISARVLPPLPPSPLPSSVAPTMEPTRASPSLLASPLRRATMSSKPPSEARKFRTNRRERRKACGGWGVEEGQVRKKKSHLMFAASPFHCRHPFWGFLLRS